MIKGGEKKITHGPFVSVRVTANNDNLVDIGGGFISPRDATQSTLGGVNLVNI